MPAGCARRGRPSGAAAERGVPGFGTSLRRRRVHQAAGGSSAASGRPPASSFGSGPVARSLVIRRAAWHGVGMRIGTVRATPVLVPLEAPYLWSYGALDGFSQTVV